MASDTEHDADGLNHEFRRALRDCRTLYRKSGQKCALEHPELISQEPGDFVALMDDLHRGLVVKVFVDMARVDWKWAREERQLAAVLFEHVWGKRLAGEPLREAILEVSDTSDRLTWASLVRPFARIAPLRNETGNLTTIVMRLANVVAKIDGLLAPEEERHLVELQDQMARHLERPIPLDAPGEHERAKESGSQAVEEMARDVAKVREECDLEPRRARVSKKTAQEQLDEAKKELDELIGLAPIKQEVGTLINFLNMQAQRREHGLAETKISLHMVFLGNPGTGKTTVARIVGKVFRAMGILEKGHLIETDRSGVVAEYAGQTAPRTNAKIDEALDGVLFIDEAYSLVSEDGSDAFGNEAVQALLKRMEDDRERLVVILAGYDKPTERLLKSNPGLSSRVSRKLVFPDYTAPELGRIFELMCKRNHYQLPAAARLKLLAGFGDLLNRRDEHFGNGRLVRNVFEEAIRRLANRLAPLAALDHKMLTTLEPEDIHFQGVAEEVWKRISFDETVVRIQCPDCGQKSGMPAKFLGRRVKCKRCEHRFRADWGELAGE